MQQAGNRKSAKPMLSTQLHPDSKSAECMQPAGEEQTRMNEQLSVGGHQSVRVIKSHYRPIEREIVYYKQSLEHNTKQMADEV